MRYILILLVIFTVSCSRKPKEEEKESRKEEIVAKSEQAIVELDKEVEEKMEEQTIARKEVPEVVKVRRAVKKIKKKEIIYPPKIQYISYSFEELKGKKNGVIDAGDRIRLNIKVKNVGRGPTSATSAKVFTPDKIVIGLPEVVLPHITPGETKMFTVDVNIPSVAPDSAKVMFEFSEGSKAELSFEIKARRKTRRQEKIKKDKQRLDKKRDERFNDLDKELGY